MEATRYFVDYQADPALAYLVPILMGVALVLGILLFIERPKHDPQRHSPRMAWLRAGIYFCFVGVVAWLTGVYGAMSSELLATPDQWSDPLWIALTALCIAVLIWGYVFWWPRGTIVHGRRLYPLPAMLFGLFWGAASAWTLLSIYALCEIFGLPGWANALITLVVIAVYNINYQSGWWDIHVSPPHNIRAWNNRKVLGAHNPFLIVTMSHFVLFGNAALFTLFYASAMACSTLAMHFPPFWEDDGPLVSLDTALGE
jgi:hypothetical protein